MRYPVIKGVYISEGILALVTLPTKGAKSLPGAENLSFIPITVNNLSTPKDVSHLAVTYPVKMEYG